MSGLSLLKKKWPIPAVLLALIGLGIARYELAPTISAPGDTSAGEARDHAPGFHDLAREAGINFHMAFLPGEQGEKFKINLYDHGCGVAVGDYDGDGFDDIYFVNQLGPNALYRNKGDGTFVDVTQEAGVGLGDRVGVGAAWGDYLNEGRPSLFVTSTRGGNVLFRNLGNGKFQDVTREAGLTHVGHSQTAVLVDYDNDGYLDLFVTNTGQWTLDAQDESRRYYLGVNSLRDMANLPKEYNILYHNEPDGRGGRHFVDVTARAGLKGQGWAGDVAVFDFNLDGALDVLVTSMWGASQLYRNNGNGTFTDVTKDTLGRTSFGAIGSKAFDFNNDGRLDLLVVDMHSDMWLPPGDEPGLQKLAEKHATAKFPTFYGPVRELHPQVQYDPQKEQKIADEFRGRYGDVVFGNTLFRNSGGGKFAEVSAQAGMETFWPWGIATGDFDNDGHEDVFLPSGMGYPFFYWPNALMLNNGDGTFADRAGAEGIEPPRGGIYLPAQIGGRPAARSSRCAATADFANAGRLDIITNNFNDAPYYFKNNFPRKNYISFRLRGAMTPGAPGGEGSNRDAVGALVKIHMGKEVMVRQVQAAGGYLSQSSRNVHFGLGERTKVDRVEIWWPSGPRGRWQTIENPALNQRHDIAEPAS